MSLEQPVEPEHQAESAAGRILKEWCCIVVVVICDGILEGIALVQELFEPAFYMPPSCFQFAEVA